MGPGQTTMTRWHVLLSCWIGFIVAAATMVAVIHDPDEADVASTPASSSTSTSTSITSTTEASATSSSTTTSTTTTTTSAPTTTTTPRSSVSLRGSIVFISDRGSPAPTPSPGPVTPGSDGYNVWVMDAIGQNQRALTTTGHDAQPHLSPDGRVLTWVVGNNQVWTMNVDGTAPRQIASCASGCSFPRWSGAGDRIAYVDYDGRIVIVDTDGAVIGEHRPAEYQPYRVGWSPDGNRLVVSVSGAPDIAGLWILDIASGTSSRIRTGNSHAPRWSPDGSSILYSDSTHLYTMNPGGGDIRQVTSGRGQSLAEGWSPDGRSIVYDHYDGDRGQVWIMNADGTDPRQLTSGSAASYQSTF